MYRRPRPPRQPPSRSTVYPGAFFNESVLLTSEGSGGALYSATAKEDQLWLRKSMEILGEQEKTMTIQLDAVQKRTAAKLQEVVDSAEEESNSFCKLLSSSLGPEPSSKQSETLPIQQPLPRELTSAQDIKMSMLGSLRPPPHQNCMS